MKTLPSLIRHPAAFSLVEVVLALGLVSFCLLSVVGLLPVGLKAAKNANEESAAANALTQLADALRNATTNSSGTYVASGAFSNITWNLGAASNSFTANLAMNGQPTNAAGSRLVAKVDIVPPADLHAAGRARVSIAWPAAATNSRTVWTKADGFINGGLQFLPKS